jgi:hypothetical protein
LRGEAYSLTVKTNNSSLVSQPIPLGGPLCSYDELQQRIRADLRAQHPEWVGSNGQSPICDLYERRFAELITFFQTGERNFVGG